MNWKVKMPATPCFLMNKYAIHVRHILENSTVNTSNWNCGTEQRRYCWYMETRCHWCEIVTCFNQLAPCVIWSSSESIACRALCGVDRVYSVYNGIFALRNVIGTCTLRNYVGMCIITHKKYNYYPYLRFNYRILVYINFHRQMDELHWDTYLSICSRTSYWLPNPYGNGITIFGLILPMKMYQDAV